MLSKLLLKESFRTDEFPSLPCPSCGASLKFEHKELLTGEESQSAALFEAGAIEYEDRRGVCSGLLRCVSPACGESVAFCGSSYYQKDDSRGLEYVAQCLVPNHFVPPLKIIAYPDKTPQPIAEELEASFSLFWANPSAAGNALRIAVERLMDYENVPQFPAKTRTETKRLHLHNRINDYYGKTNPERANLLLAIKWIGNAGSHKSKMTRQAMLNGYRIFEQVLMEMFSDRKSISRLAKKIVRTKGRMKAC
jgi:hypothetical protein